VEHLGGTRARTGRVIASLPTPLAIVTAFDGRVRAGCLVSFHTHVSISPHRYLVCLARPNRTHWVAQRSQHLAVHAVSQDHKDVAELFGGSTGDDTDKFAACNWRNWKDGTPLLEDVRSWLVGAIRSQIDLGDHSGFLLDVVATAPPVYETALTLHDLGPLDAGHPL
jgi:flavin reductase (DIM6/NTAB) family NADH-FMN oxidoreductase RutF